MAEICVVGSINIDVVTAVDTYPERGQTIFGNNIMEFLGGKGANQSIACAKQKKQVTLIGSIGEDAQGDKMLEGLRGNHVDVSHIKRIAGENSGQTTIILDNQAENTIIYVEGANGKLDPEYVAEKINSLEGCEILLAQMETPYETILAAMKAAKEKGIKVILDPAPANKVTDEMLAYADFVLPNIHETEILTGIVITDEETAKQAAQVFLSKGVQQGVLKLGGSGSYVFEGEELTFIDGIEVEAIDTVGAGDCFAGALASALLDGESLVNAATYANVVAALKVTKRGAQAGIPTLEEVTAFAETRNLPIYLRNE